MKVVKALHENAAELKASSPVWALWDPKQMAKKQGDLSRITPARSPITRRSASGTQAGH